MPHTAYCPHPDNLEQPVELTDEWHRQQERLEREWLDNWARAQHLVLVTAA